MDKQQAQEIIKNTFENPFDKVRFTNFVKNLLNRIDESKAFHAHGYVLLDRFKKTLKHVQYFDVLVRSNDDKIKTL